MCSPRSSITGGGISSLLGKGVVKSVQRGMLDRSAAGKQLTNGSTENIAISDVDVLKSALLVCIEGHAAIGSADAIVCYTLESNKIVIKNKTDGDAYVAISWQVIEFY